MERLTVDGLDPASIAAHLPTAVTSATAPWIGVDGPPHRRPASRAGPPGDSEAALVADLVTAFQRGLSAEARAGGRGATAASIRAATIKAMLARAASVEPGGKWVLTAPAGGVDAAWTKTARLTAAGALGPAAKVATSDPPRPPGAPPQAYALIIYTASFADAADVRRVLDALVAAGLALRLAGGGERARRPVGYKVNAWTLLEVVRRGGGGTSLTSVPPASPHTRPPPKIKRRTPTI